MQVNFKASFKLPYSDDYTMDDFDLLLKSAKGGDAEAQFQVAYAYEMGDGVAKNYKKAMHWYKLAAKQNHVKAQLSMATFITAVWVSAKIMRKLSSGTSLLQIKEMLLHRIISEFCTD